MNKLLLFTTSLTLLLSSCSNSSTNSDVVIPEGNIKPLALLVDIETPVTKNRNTAAPQSFNNEVRTDNLSQIGVHICQHEKFGTAYTSGSHNLTWTKTEDKWTPATPILLGSDNANVYAYYPYSNNESLPVNAINVAVGDTDYLFGKATTGSNEETFVANNKNTVANIKLKHAMSQIIWNFTKDASYTGNAVVTNITINKLNKNGALNIESGRIATTGDKEEHSMAVSLNVPASKNLMIIPTSYEPKTLSMSFTIDGKTMTSTLGAITFDRAMKYNFNVKVKGTGIEIGSVTVEPWGEGADQNLEIN